MRKGTLLLTLPLLLIAAAPPTLGADQDNPTPAAAEQAGPSMKVTLEDAGGAPKTALRYSPGVGDLQTILLSISTSVTNQMGNLPMPAMTLPTTTSTLTARVDDLKDGRITSTIRIDDAKLTDTDGVQPMIVKQMEATTKNSIGQSAKLVINDRGIGQSISFDEDAKADPATAQSLASLESTLAMLATPLPEQPVGPGARWTAETKLQQQAIDVNQKVTYTLKSIKDGVLNLELKIEHSAPAQDVAMPGAPPGTKVKLTSLSLEGSGTATINLHHVAPMQAELSSSSVSEIDITQSNGGQPQHFKQTMDSHATVEQNAGKDTQAPTKEKEADKPE